MRRFVTFGPALVVLLTAAVLLFAAPESIRRIGYAHTSARIVLAQRLLDEDDILERINLAVRGIAESVQPAVVHIEVVPQRGAQRMLRSSGSGWVYDSRGHIVTNAHVVRAARALEVHFADGRVVQAERVHGQLAVADPFTDIAVIKVPQSQGLYPVRRATGEAPRQGDRVFAFGSPFGFRFSMSQGIISGLGRDPATALDARGFTNFIQTDAAVNPGNSGGPLVDVKGRVVGMNVAIATGHATQGTTEGQSAGISFAIPLATIESVVDQLVERGEVRRGFLGITLSGQAAPFAVDGEFKGVGVHIADVVADGPAAQAGLRPGDVVVAIGDQATSSSEVLRSVVSSTRPGSRVAVRVWRSGQEREFEIELGSLPMADLAFQGAESSLLRFGMLLRNRAEGPVIAAMVEGSQAESAGFQEGQLILSVGDIPVRDYRSAYIAMADQGLLLGRPVSVTVSPRTEAGSGEPTTLTIQAR